MNNSVVIAGNGPSLASIDYSKLPINFDVFRCNQFYFEDKYFLGRRITKVFFRPMVFFEQYYTIKNLIQRGEYDCEEIIFAGNDSLDIKRHGFMLTYAIDVIDGYEKYISTLKEFDLYKNFKCLYYNQYISMGVYMCAVAVACGYKELYLAGIDMYAPNDGAYAFSLDKNNISSLINTKANVSSDYSKGNSYHNIFTDLDALNFLLENYNVKIYSVCPTSQSAKYFPIPLNNNLDFNVEEKSHDALKDIIIPNKNAYLKLRDDRHQIKDNLVFRLFYDIYKLPSQLVDFVFRKIKNRYFR